jgi:phospholipid N-methyltransferase
MATSFPTDVPRLTSYVERSRKALEPLGLFFGEFVREPAMVGSAVPSSRKMVERLLEPVDWSRIRLLVEYGAGTGQLTRAALERMNPAARLIALDTSPGFTRYLRRAISDPRLRPVTASAADIGLVLADEGLSGVDCILSGIPFSTMKQEVAWRIMDATAQLLNRDGLFIAYQMRTAIEPLIRTRFARVRRAYEWRNLPPCHLYWAEGCNLNPPSRLREG